MRSLFLTLALLLGLFLGSADAIKVYRKKKIAGPEGPSEAPMPDAKQGKASTVKSLATPDVERITWIAVLKDNWTQLPDMCEDVICLDSFKHALNALVVSATVDEVNQWAYRFEERLKYIEESKPVSPLAVEDVTDFVALDRIDQINQPLDGKYYFSSAAKGVTIYIIDTEVNVQHQDFQTSLTDTTSRVTQLNPAGIDDGTATCVVEEAAHGTHVAGIAAGLMSGVGKQATVMAIKGLKCTGDTSAELVIRAIDYIARTYQKPAVLSLSIGAADRLVAFGDAIKRIIALGIPVVTAAGNSRYDACYSTPSFVPDVVSVGSVNAQDQLSYFSNVGPCIKLFAPGEAVRSADYLDNTAYRYLSGTSMSAPFVSGAIALYLENHPLAPPALLSHIVTKVASPSVIGHVNGTNKLLYVPPMSSDLIDMSPMQYTIPEDFVTTSQLSQPGRSFTVSTRLTRLDSGTQSTTVQYTLSDSRRGVITPSTIQFDSSNWNTYQTLTINLTDANAPSLIGVDFYIDAVVVAELSPAVAAGQQASSAVHDTRTYVDLPGGSIDHALNANSLPAIFDFNTARGQLVDIAPCNFSTSNSPQMWVKYVSPVDTTINITTCNSYFDTTLALMWETPPGSGTFEGVCNDDVAQANVGDNYYCGLNEQSSQIVYHLVANRVYYVMVGGLNSDSGQARVVLSRAGDTKNYAYPPAARFDINNPLPPAPAPPTVVIEVPIIPVKGGILSQNLIFAVAFGAGGIIFAIGGFAAVRFAYIKIVYTRHGLPEPPIFSMPSRATLLKSFYEKRAALSVKSGAALRAASVAMRRLGSRTAAKDGAVPRLKSSTAAAVRFKSTTAAARAESRAESYKAPKGKATSGAMSARGPRKSGAFTVGAVTFDVGHEDAARPASETHPRTHKARSDTGRSTPKKTPVVKFDEKTPRRSPAAPRAGLRTPDEAFRPPKSGVSFIRAVTHAIIGARNHPENLQPSADSHAEFHPLGVWDQDLEHGGADDDVFDTPCESPRGGSALLAAPVAVVGGMPPAEPPIGSRAAPGPGAAAAAAPVVPGLNLLSDIVRAATLAAESSEARVSPPPLAAGWTCHVCKRKNGPDAATCLACSGTRPSSPVPLPGGAAPSAYALGGGAAAAAPVPEPPRASWRCKHCRLLNNLSAKACEGCARKRQDDK